MCFEKGHETSRCCLPAAFTEPANFDVRCGNDIYFTANFTYWEVMQGGMDLAIPGQATAISPSVGTVSFSATGQDILVQDDQFKPGFQVGFGWTGGWDGWSLYGEYTWVRGTTHTSASAPAPGATSAGGVTVPQFAIFFPTSWWPDVYLTNACTTISSKWHYALDIADLQLARPSYIGTRFTLEPFCGLRGLWIRQSMNIRADAIHNSLGGAIPAQRQARYTSHSWAVGPRAGLNGNWHLGYGMRLIGDGSASLLYTRYTKVSQNVQSPDITSLPVSTELDDYGALRPNLDLSLGFGWGSYFYCRRIHLDLSATYDFSVFWEQNMMRYLASLTSSISSHPAGAPANMYIQGMTLKGAIEF
ncbi:MAG: hypothetical protein KGR16_04350 [Verrucomicrobia bacterium]|nr:hypothetical protein [Verrucomicrobiota bacterium]